MTFEERAMAALGSVILLISQTMDTAKNRRKHCDERAKLMSDTEEKFCFELIAAIKRAGIDYDVSIAEIKALQEEVGKTIHNAMRGAFAAPKDLNAGQRPGLVGCASTPPAGGARYSAFDLEGRSCAK